MKRSRPDPAEKIQRFLRCEALREPPTSKRQRTEINSNLNEQLELGAGAARNPPAARKDKRAQAAKSSKRVKK